MKIFLLISKFSFYNRVYRWLHYPLFELNSYVILPLFVSQKGKKERKKSEKWIHCTRLNQTVLIKAQNTDHHLTPERKGLQETCFVQHYSFQTDNNAAGEYRQRKLLEPSSKKHTHIRQCTNFILLSSIVPLFKLRIMKIWFFWVTSNIAECIMSTSNSFHESVNIRINCER